MDKTINVEGNSKVNICTETITGVLELSCTDNEGNLVVISISNTDVMGIAIDLLKCVEHTRG